MSERQTIIANDSSTGAPIGSIEIIEPKNNSQNSRKVDGVTSEKKLPKMSSHKKKQAEKSKSSGRIQNSPGKDPSNQGMQSFKSLDSDGHERVPLPLKKVKSKDSIPPMSELKNDSSDDNPKSVRIDQSSSSEEFHQQFDSSSSHEIVSNEKILSSKSLPQEKNSKSHNSVVFDETPKSRPHTQSRNRKFTQSVSIQKEGRLKRNNNRVKTIQTSEEEPIPLSGNVPNSRSEPVLNISERRPDKRISFLCEKKKTSIFFNTTEYSLISDGFTIMSAKTRGNNEDPVFINNGEDVHISDSQHDFVLTVDKEFREFNLYTNNDKGQLLTKINISTVDAPFRYSRYFKVVLQSSSKSTYLYSLVPKKRADGKYSLPFGPTFVQNSLRNGILVDDQNNRVIFVKQLKSDRLEIEVSDRVEIPLEAVFAVALSSWLCPY